MGKEVSRKIVTIVLILAIVISSYMTLMTLRNIDGFGEQGSGNNVYIQTAAVSLNVLTPESPRLETNSSAKESGVNND